VDPERVVLLNGDRDELIKLLQDHCDFTSRRAKAEVDEFVREFHSKLERATVVNAQRETAATNGSQDITPGNTDIAAA
jgi:hypothetical protein